MAIHLLKALFKVIYDSKSWWDTNVLQDGYYVLLCKIKMNKLHSITWNTDILENHLIFANNIGVE